MAKDPIMTYPQTWTLSTIFSEETVGDFLQEIAADLSSISLDNISQAIPRLEMTGEKIAEVSSFAICLSSEDFTNQFAKELLERITSLDARYDSLSLKIDKKLAALSSKSFEELLTQDTLKHLAFSLSERREQAHQKLSNNEEEIITKLSIDGYNGLSQIYDALIADTSFPLNGENLTLGQLENILSEPSKERRDAAFLALKQVFKTKEGVYAQTLNHLGGFRLQMYELRGWNDILQEPLQDSRMSQQTLDAMWGAVNKHKDIFVQCIDKKAQILGQSKLSFYDVEAPLPGIDQYITYDEGADFIVTQFQKYSPKMAEFAKRAIENGWIEAEDRKNKRPGGFCTDFPLKNESRIFMTYNGTQTNVTTLAHELGHAFHNEVLYPLSPFNRNIRMNVAETASTMAEMIVADAALQSASTPEKKLAMLDDKVFRSVAFIMNLQARFLFETRFYKERKEGFVSPDRLSTLMEEAQKEAFGDALSEYHPHFWASKLHFYITEVPFYNFPYTFGYLFSLGIYAMATADPASFEEKYIALLKDTAQMNVEDLAKKHLNVDLTKPDFWEMAMENAVKDAKEYLSY
jgi:oligoendopeptidase F